QLLEDVNQAAIKNPIVVGGLMEQAAKRGDLLPIPSGTTAKFLSSDKLRGPMFKEITQVELTQGPQKGLRGWVCTKSLVSDEEFARIRRRGKEKKARQRAFHPLFRDPLGGEKVSLARQPTMFGIVRSLTRLYAVNDSAPAVFKEWHEATEATRDSVLRRL